MPLAFEGKKSNRNSFWARNWIQRVCVPFQSWNKKMRRFLKAKVSAQLAKRHSLQWLLLWRFHRRRGCTCSLLSVSRRPGQPALAIWKSKTNVSLICRSTYIPIFMRFRRTVNVSSMLTAKGAYKSTLLLVNQVFLSQPAQVWRHKNGQLKTLTTMHYPNGTNCDFICDFICDFLLQIYMYASWEIIWSTAVSRLQ